MSSPLQLKKRKTVQQAINFKMYPNFKILLYRKILESIKQRLVNPIQIDISIKLDIYKTPKCAGHENLTKTR